MARLVGCLSLLTARSGEHDQPMESNTKEEPRHIVMVAFRNAQLLDVAGPLEVFANANYGDDPESDRLRDLYRVEVVGPARGRTQMASGLGLHADRAFDEVESSFDTLMLAGGEGTPAATRDPDLMGFLRRVAPGVRRIASVCTGAFLLGEAGLLEGRRVTTHWRWCEQLAERYENLRVESDPIFVRDGHVWTSAGVCAGMDLALALIEQDHGRPLALAVARRLVLHLKRPGGQPQFSCELRSQSLEHDSLRELQTWAQANLRSDLSVNALARRAGMSSRNFSRVFAREVGETPARWIEHIRVEAAKRLLEETPIGVDEVALRAGFASAEVLRRSFMRRLRIGPTAYRERLRSGAA